MFKDTILKRTHALPFSFFSRWQTLYCKEKRPDIFPQYSPDRQFPDLSRHVFSTAHPPRHTPSDRGLLRSLSEHGRSIFEARSERLRSKPHIYMAVTGKKQGTKSSFIRDSP